MVYSPFLFSSSFVVPEIEVSISTRSFVLEEAVPGRALSFTPDELVLNSTRSFVLSVVAQPTRERKIRLAIER
jgi:hypothetical protein